MRHFIKSDMRPRETRSAHAVEMHEQFCVSEQGVEQRGRQLNHLAIRSIAQEVQAHVHVNITLGLLFFYDSGPGHIDHATCT